MVQVCGPSSWCKSSTFSGYVLRIRWFLPWIFWCTSGTAFEVWAGFLFWICGALCNALGYESGWPWINLLLSKLPITLLSIMSMIIDEQSKHTRVRDSSSWLHLLICFHAQCPLAKIGSSGRRSLQVGSWDLGILLVWSDEISNRVSGSWKLPDIHAFSIA